MIPQEEGWRRHRLRDAGWALGMYHGQSLAVRH